MAAESQQRPLMAPPPNQRQSQSQSYSASPSEESQKGGGPSVVVHLPRDQLYPQRQHQPPLPPQYRKRAPPKRRRSRCCCCIIIILCILLSLVTVLAAAAAIVYLIYRPHVPAYSVRRLHVDTFAVGGGSLDAALQLDLAAANDNRNVALTYGPGEASVGSGGGVLAQGHVAAFWQPPQNTTVVPATVTGAGPAPPGFSEAAARKGRVSLKVRMAAPARVHVGALPLPRLRVHVECDVVVDRLAPQRTCVLVSSPSCSSTLRLPLHLPFGYNVEL